MLKAEPSPYRGTLRPCWKFPLNTTSWDTTGLTGLWWVSGRPSLLFERAIGQDVHHLKGASPWLDSKIMLKMIPAFLSNRRALYEPAMTLSGNPAKRLLGIRVSCFARDYSQALSKLSPTVEIQGADLFSAKLSRPSSSGTHKISEPLCTCKVRALAIPPPPSPRLGNDSFSVP